MSIHVDDLKLVEKKTLPSSTKRYVHVLISLSLVLFPSTWVCGTNGTMIRIRSRA